MQETPPSRAFPGIVQALGLLCLLGGVGLVGLVVWMVVSGDPLLTEEGEVVGGARAALVVNTTSFLVVLGVGWRVAGGPLAAVFPVRGMAWPLVPAVGAAMAGLIPVMMGLLQLVLEIPGLRFLEDTFHEFGDRVVSMVREDPAASLVLLVVVAPVTEELFFRGLLLRGFRERYGPRWAVVLSALLFSVAHLSPAQLPATVMLGLFLGWLYLRTGNLTPCVLAHALNNGLASVALFLQPAQYATAPEEARVPVGVLVAGALLLAAGVTGIHRLTAPVSRPVSPPPHL